MFCEFSKYTFFAAFTVVVWAFLGIVVFVIVGEGRRNLFERALFVPFPLIPLVKGQLLLLAGSNLDRMTAALCTKSFYSAINEDRVPSRLLYAASEQIPWQSRGDRFARRW